MNTLLKPMLAEPALIGSTFLILLGLLILLAVVAGIIALLSLIVRHFRKAGANAPSSFPIQPPPVVPATQVMPRKCPQCGAPLQPDVPEGLCPACLMQRGFATEGGVPPGSPPFVPPTIPELTKLFPQLEILELIGKGGMGAVYKARQPALDRFVALKILAPRSGGDLDFAGRFTREARALARLSHPNIVGVSDFGEMSGHRPEATPLHYFIMEFVDGPNLRQAGKVSPREAMEIIPQICAALQFAHDEGIVHRDIKPENVLLDKKGRVKIADFGLAKILGQEQKDLRLTGVRDVMGTPHYMAPEQVERPQDVDHRADIYSLGVVFYELLTGELPLGKFQSPSQKVSVDVRLDEVVMRSLAKEPERRYQHVSEMGTRVETIAGTPSPESGKRKAESGNSSPGILASSGKITAPAVALMVAAAWKILSGIPSVFILSRFGVLSDQFFGVGNFFGAWGPSAFFWASVLFQIIPGALILFGGYQMLKRHSYAWAIAAGILAIVTCSLISLPIGIWALIVLSGEDVKAAFGCAAPAAISTTPAPDRFWRRFAVLLACVILIPVVIAAFGILAAIAIPAFAKARNRAQAVAAHNQRALAEHNSAAVFDHVGKTWFPKGDSIEILSVERSENEMKVKGLYNLISANNARLALYVTSTNDIATTEAATQSMLVAHGTGDFELVYPHRVAGLPHVTMYAADGKGFAEVYFGSQDEAAAESKLEPGTTNAAAASAETWSPPLAPGGKPDLQKLLQDATKLMEVEHFEEALQHHLWYHRHALEYDPAQTGVRLSFALSDWIELGKRYPKAKQALLEIRDADAQALTNGTGNFQLLQDASSINDYLGDREATYRLFEKIEQRDPALAKQGFGLVEDLLVQHGDYEKCLTYIGDPQTAFASLQQMWERIKKSEEQSSTRRAEQNQHFRDMAKTNSNFANVPMLREPPPYADKRFVSQTRQLIEILVATDHQPDAEKIRDQALAILDDAQLKSAVTDAEIKTHPSRKAAVEAATNSAVALNEPVTLHIAGNVITNPPIHVTVITNTNDIPTLTLGTITLITNPIVHDTAAENQQRELLTRFSAAQGIVAFAERDTAMTGIARDAARATNVELAKKALEHITFFAQRDAATLQVARELAKNGWRAEAVAIAKGITAFAERDAALKELAR